jgi:hypothetical protein
MGGSARFAVAAMRACSRIASMIAGNPRPRRAQGARLTLAALLFLSAAMALAAPQPDREPIAKNFGPDISHSIRDLFAFLGPDALEQGVEAAILSSADSVYTDKVRLAPRGWIGRYRFLGDRVRVFGDLGVFPGASAAGEALDELRRDVLRLIEEDGIAVERIGGPHAPGRSGDYYLLRNAEDAPFGSLFVVAQDRRWYTLMIMGIHFETIEDAEAFLEPKLSRLLAFEPDLGGRTYGEIITAPLCDYMQTLSHIILFALIVVYWLLRAMVGIVNRSRPGRPVSGPAIGVGAVCLLGFAATSFGFWLTSQLPPEVVGALTPEEIGRLHGRAIGVGLVPVMFILIPIGIASWIRSKPDIGQRPPG